MPSPVGHGLAGIAAGWAVGRPARLTRALVVQSLTIAAIGMAPDLDLLWGRHGRETHSIGAAVIVASLAAWRRWPVGAETRGRIFATVLLAWLIHPVLDVFSVDNNPPLGVMLWWPFNDRFVHSSYTIFDAISRMWNSPDVWTHNATAAAHELLLIAPLVAVIWLVRRRR
jgi:LexA-binding, inner membrane-associated putative hydrolase